MIPIYKPGIKNYKNSAINAINSEWISNYGEYIEKASNKLKNIFNMNYCILMNNGTSATQCLIYSLKFKYPNIKKIYIPNNVFISPINCVLNCYDKENIEIMKMDEKTLNIDVSEKYIKSLDKNSAILIVHNIGNIINVPRLKRLRPDIIFIEDNCEGIFGKYENIYSGTISLCSAVSFYANKTITTGEGGAFFTNDKDIYDYIIKTYSHGMTNKKYIHDIIGYNYRMTNVAAGLLYEQLLDLDNIIKIKKNIFTNYYSLIDKEKLNNQLINNKIVYINNENNTKHSYWMFSIIIKDINYNIFETFMNNNNIEIRPIFYDLRKHTHLTNLNFKYKKIDAFENGFMLPSYPTLSYEKQEYIVKKIILFINLYLNN